MQIHIKNNLSGLSLSLVLKISRDVFNLIELYLIGIIFKSIAQANWNEFLNTLCLMIAVSFLAFIFFIINRKLDICLKRKLSNEIRNHVLLNAKFFANEDHALAKGKISSILFKTIPEIIQKRIFGFITMISNLTLLVLASCLILYYFWGMFLIMISLVVISIFVSMYISKFLTKIQTEEYESINKHDRKTTKILSFFNNFYFKKSDSLLQKELKHNSTQFKNKMVKLNLKTNIISYPINFIHIFFQTVNGAICSILFFYGLIPLPALVVTPFLFGSISMDLNDALKFGTSYKAIKGVLDKIFPPTSEKDVAKFIDIKKITFNNLNFKFNHKKLYTQNKEIKFHENKRYLITGPSGVGKSIIIKSLFQKIDYQGQIKINESSLKKHNFTSLSKSIKLLETDSQLFDDTVLNNITLFDSFPKKEVKNILNIVNLKQNILSQRSGNLSEGQKQRVALASILITQPKWLVIDEGLSNVDEKTFNLIFKNLASLPISMINISHNINIERSIYDQEIIF